MKARLANLKVVIGFDKTKLRELNKNIRDTRGKFRRNFGEIAGMAKNAALAITGTLVAGIGALIKKGAEMETLRTGFISIAGGANKAAAIVKELNEFTATTPFQLEQVSVAARQLLAVGTKRSELQKELRMLGDIAASSGNSIEDIAAIFSKVKAKGKVELENLNQLAERGIPIFDQLRLVTGDANMEFGAGAVSVEEFNTALANMTAEGGLAAGAMENLSKTVEGRISTLLDNVGLELAGFAEKTGVTDAFSNLLEETTEALKGVSGVTQTDLSAALGQAEEAMEAFGTVTTDNVDEVETAMLAASDAISEVIKSAGEGAQKRTLFAAFTGGTKGLKKSLQAQADAIKPLIEMQKLLQETGATLNEQIMDGTVARAEEVAVVEGVVEAKKQEKKAKEELVAVERSHMQALGKVKELQSETAVNTLAAVYANKQLKGSYQEVGANIDATKMKTTELSEAFTSAARNMAVSAGTIAGAMIAGTASARDMGNMVLDTLAGLAIEVGQMAIATGIAIEGIKSALKTLNPAAALAAGIALVALGSFVRSSLSKKASIGDVPQMADGGLFSGASLAYVGEGPGTSMINPEVVAPLDKLQQMMGGGHVTVTGMIRGSDILISNERATLDRNRVRGF